RAGSPLQVMCLQDGGAAKEGKRGFGHAREADRQQFLNAAFIGLLDKGQRIALGRAQNGAGMARSRPGLSTGLSLQPGALGVAASCTGVASINLLFSPARPLDSTWVSFEFMRHVLHDVVRIERRKRTLATNQQGAPASRRGRLRELLHSPAFFSPSWGFSIR